MKLVLGNRNITIYNRKEERAKYLVVMNEDHKEGQEIWESLPEAVQERMDLACIDGIRWEEDLTPWSAPALFKKAPPFTGGADAYGKEVCDRILPAIESQMQKSYEKIYIAGYSLAGLFALYSAITTGRFDGFVSASGSLWYPKLLEYVTDCTLPERVKSAYFSVGDKEAKTKNPVMQTVEERTRAIEELLSKRDVKTIFVLNQGGHFSEDAKRLADGIEWIVTKGQV